jgi:hypothetical protein
VIKFVSDLRQVGGFLRILPPIKLTATIIDITEKLLKVALNTIALKPPSLHHKKEKISTNLMGNFVFLFSI